MYYLNSRYYNPEWGRFINADALVGQTGELLGHNMFVYCKNNPINMNDNNGFKANWARIAGGFASFACGFAAIVIIGVSLPVSGVALIGVAIGGALAANSMITGAQDMEYGFKGSNKQVYNPGEEAFGALARGVHRAGIMRKGYGYYGADEQAGDTLIGKSLFKAIDAGAGIKDAAEKGLPKMISAFNKSSAAYNLFNWFEGLMEDDWGDWEKVDSVTTKYGRHKFVDEYYTGDHWLTNLHE